MISTIAAVLMLAGLTSPPVTTQTPGDAVAANVKRGVKVTVVTVDGQELEGRVDAAIRDNLRLSLNGGRSTDIPVDRIVRIARRDDVRDGALIGLGVGFGLGVIGGITDPPARRSGRAAIIAWRMVGSGLIWTGVGMAIDALADNRRTLYQRAGSQARVSPLAGHGVRGIALSITW